ncbi:hypothetical protein B194_4438 [Serratia plymuthica A30]|nr:hypothetical protein B194_4438 [Serratia plymuthica A30]
MLGLFSAFRLLQGVAYQCAETEFRTEKGGGTEAEINILRAGAQDLSS